MKRRSRNTVSQPGQFEVLENRQMFAAGLPSMSFGDLTFNGTNNNDVITVVNAPRPWYMPSNFQPIDVTINGVVSRHTVLPGKQRLVINGLGGQDQITVDANIECALYGGEGNDILKGGPRNDRLYGGNGTDRLYGRDGDDTLVSVDGVAEGTYGGNGNDTFWVDGPLSVYTPYGSITAQEGSDVSTAEVSAGTVHQIRGYEGSVSKKLDGQDLTDPGLTKTSYTYKSGFSDQPLFTSSGPSKDDVNQGDVGDCWMLASFSAVAKTRPEIIRQSVVDLGDGTFAAEFHRSGNAVYVRVDGQLPVTSGGDLAYAKLGTAAWVGRASWVPILEKAAAQFFNTTTRIGYNSLHNGIATGAYEALGITNTWDYPAGNVASGVSAANMTTFLNRVRDGFRAGRAVTIGFGKLLGNLPSQVFGEHAYTVENVITDASNNVTSLRLRNPWGNDQGPGATAIDGTNDGYVTVTVAELQKMTNIYRQELRNGVMRTVVAFDATFGTV